MADTVSPGGGAAAPERSVRLREAGEGDLKVLARLYREWDAEGVIRGLIVEGPRQLRKYLGPLFLVAESGEGQIVGFAFATEHVADRNCAAVFEPGTPYFQLEDVYVAPGWRSRGVGSMLLEAVTEAAGRRGVRRALVYSSSVDWERVVAFYARQGFKMWFFQMFK